MISLRTLLFSVKPQHELAIDMHISSPFWNSLPTPSPSHPSRLIQSPCLSFLSHRENSHWLSILHMVMYVSRRNEETEPKQKQHPVVDVTGDRIKVRCCKEQYCIGTWNVRSMNQSKLKVVKQEMARVKIKILGISELKWIGMGEFNSDDHYIYYCGQESLRRNGVAITVNKRVWNTVLGCNLKNDRMISVHFQEKPFNIMVIQVYAPTRNA